MKSRLSLILVLASLLAACGDGGGSDIWSSTSTPPGGVVLSPEAQAAGEAIVADLGPEPAPLAVAYALDRGYTSGQIAEAGLSGGLQADGTIDGVGAALAQWGLFSDLPGAGGSGAGGGQAGLLVLAFADDPVTAAEFLAEATQAVGAVMGWNDATAGASPDRAAVVIGVILSLADLGYSPGQIFLGIAAGEIRPVLAPSQWGIGCWFLSDDDGNPIPADGPAVEAFSDTSACRESLGATVQSGTEGATSSTTTTTTATGAEVSADGLYIGTVTAGAAAAGFMTIQESSARITIDDGVAEVLLDVTAETTWVVGDASNPPCISTDHWVFQGTGTAAGATVSVDLALVTFELISISGCDREGEEEETEGETTPLTATISGEVLTGSTFQDLLVVTATRQ